MTTDQINIDDLRERAKTMHARALMHHYGVTGGKMHRMLKKYGIKAATYVRTDRAYSSRYADLPEKIGTMTRSEMAVHYGSTLKTLHSRTEESRVGKGCVSTFRSRRSTYLEN